MFLYKKQIRPIFKESAWQGFSFSCVPLEDWIDISTNEEDIEKELKEKWTDEKKCMRLPMIIWDILDLNIDL